MRIPALGSLRSLRRHLAPTARSRLGRGRLQGNVSTAIEWPAPKGLAQLKLGPANNIVSSRATRSLMAEAICSVTQVRGYEEPLPHGREADRSMDTKALC